MNEILKSNRPYFHITGGKGWINDPNGLVIFNGEYHIFFQYYPHDTKWGPMHWGHAKSKDLQHWEHLPIALYPDENEMCFSGSAIVWNDKLWLMYTGHIENKGGDTIIEQQCLASSTDGIHFEKHGVVIGKDLLPNDYCINDFRDPKIFRNGDLFYCIVASKRRNGRGRILAFVSNDLFRWKFLSDVFGVDGQGSMTECPDYNPIIQMIIHSQQFAPQCGIEHCNIHSTFYCFGEFDKKGMFTKNSEQSIVDYGFDFYAPQTFATEPIMIAWLNMWDRSNPSVEYGFAGQLTVARKLSRRDGRLYQSPIFDGKQVAEMRDFMYLCDTFKVGKITLDLQGLNELSIKLRKQGESYASFDLNNGQWIFNRSKCGKKIDVSETDEDSINGIRKMPVIPSDETHIEIVSDLYSLEIFVDGMAMSSVVYPSQDADGLEIVVNAKKSTYKKFEIQ